MKQSWAFNPAFCTAIFLSSIAFAQTADPNRFQQFLASDFHKGLVMRAISLIPKDVFRTCPTLKSSGPAVAVTRPVTFGQDGRMTSGAWWERLPVSGCNNDTILNIFFAVSSDSKINTTTGHPGTTHADLVLQHDALQYAYQAAATQGKACNHFDVMNTRFEGYGLKKPPTPDPGVGSRFRPWWETWTIIGCGHLYDMPMNFIPDQTGTTIAVPLGDTIEQ